MSSRNLEQEEFLIGQKPNGVIGTSAETLGTRLKSGSNYQLNDEEDHFIDQTELENQINENLTEKVGDLYSKLNLFLSEGEGEGGKGPGPPFESSIPYLYTLLVCLDYFISAFIVAPLVVGCWLSLWTIIDQHPDVFIQVNSYLFGSTLIFVLTLIREDVIPLLAEFNKRCLRTCYAITSRAYVYLFFFCGILQWRSLWSLLDEYFAKDVRAVSLLTGISLMIVLFFKMSESLLAPPYFVGKDTNPSDVFIFPTWWSLSPKENNILLYSLDCFFSVFVIGSLLVFVWRGAWTLIDIFLLPDDLLTSSWYSLVIGYIVVFITFALQPIVKRIVKQLRGLLRLCIVDIYLIFSFTGTINVWRGIWNLLNHYFLPNSPTMSAWICHIGCFLLLILINSSNSVLVRGVYVDAEEEGSKCVDFPCYYLRLFFLDRRKKQLLRQFQKRQVHNLIRRKSEADGYVSGAESSPPQKTKLEESSVIV